MLERHPSWFKMKIERRELIRQLSPETAVNVLLACWEFLETGEKPASLSPIESVAFASFMPDMNEAWKRYLQRITARNQSTDIDRYHTTSTETEEETEIETEEEFKKDIGGKPSCSRFSPPTVKEEAAVGGTVLDIPSLASAMEISAAADLDIHIQGMKSEIFRSGLMRLCPAHTSA